MGCRCPCWKRKTGSWCGSDLVFVSSTNQSSSSSCNTRPGRWLLVLEALYDLFSVAERRARMLSGGWC